MRFDTFKHFTTIEFIERLPVDGKNGKMGQNMTKENEEKNFQIHKLIFPCVWCTVHYQKFCLHWNSHESLMQKWSFPIGWFPFGLFDCVNITALTSFSFNFHWIWMQFEFIKEINCSTRRGQRAKKTEMSAKTLFKTFKKKICIFRY